MRSLHGRTAVITGAGSGIGRALARCCAGCGMRLVLADLDEEGMAATAHSIETETIAVRTDVSHPQSVQALAELAFTKYGEVGLLFNNAGVATGGCVWESTPEDWAWVLGVNLMGVVHGIQAFVPRMLAQELPGRVVNTASAAGLITLPGASVYCASKHAVVALSECLHQELQMKKAAIGVSVLCPSYVRTGIGDSERHRPPELQRAGNVLPTGNDKLVRGMRAATLSAEDIAEFVLGGVLKDDFYLVPHAGVISSFRDRADRMVNGLPPGRGSLPVER